MNTEKKINFEAIIPELINRLLNCNNSNTIKCYGKFDDLLDGLCPNIQIIRISNLKEVVASDFVFVVADNAFKWEALLDYLSEGINTVIYIKKSVTVPLQYQRQLKASSFFQEMPEGTLYCTGKLFRIPNSFKVPKSFKVLAIVHFFNEEDIIEKTVEYLLDQGLHVYLLDNWSTDDSYKIATELKNRNPDKIYLEQYPDQPSNDYRWYEQLARTEELSYELNYDWYTHYDMDEIRTSPWQGRSLLESIAYIDSLGYNCMENTVIDFRITKEDDHIFAQGRFFDFRYKYHWIDQLKTWKRQEHIDLKSSGGHRVRFKQPQIFPLKLLNMHYPLRSLTQAHKKIYEDRLPRFKMENEKRGWHTQYDLVKGNEGVIYDENTLFQWNSETVDDLWITLFSECGLRKLKEKDLWELPQIEGKRVAIYGAGRVGRYTCNKMSSTNQIVSWVDRNYLNYPSIYCITIMPPDTLIGVTVDYIVIAVIDESTQIEIKKYLIKCGFSSEMILCVKNKQCGEQK